MNIDDKEALRLLIRESVREGIRAYHEEMNITPDHWAFLRSEWEKSRDSGRIIRRVVIGTVLGAAVLFGYNSMVDKLAQTVAAHLAPTQQVERR